MTNEKFNSEEIMNEVELDSVAGGTVAELNDLVKAVTGNDGLRGFMGDVYEVVGSKMPPGNIAMAEILEKQLKDIGVSAKISVGWGGTGFRSVSNSYTFLGRPASHDEVCKYISKMCA